MRLALSQLHHACVADITDGVYAFLLPLLLLSDTGSRARVDDAGRVTLELITRTDCWANTVDGCLTIGLEIDGCTTTPIGFSLANDGSLRSS